MILADIKNYLQGRGQVALSDLAVHFDTDPDAMRGMLDQWVRKGKVSRIELKSGCGSGCASCSCDANLEIYEWRP